MQSAMAMIESLHLGKDFLFSPEVENIHSYKVKDAWKRQQGSVMKKSVSPDINKQFLPLFLPIYMIPLLAVCIQYCLEEYTN